jgi:hypothetical protein
MVARRFVCVCMGLGIAAGSAVAGNGPAESRGNDPSLALGALTEATRSLALGALTEATRSLALGALITAAPASQPASWAGRPSEMQIREMIRQLNHPIHARRRAAIRQLAEWGPVAFPELRQAAKSGNMETALSARELLGELESAVLIGAQVRLEVDRPRIAWNEGFTLTVHALNSTGEKIEVPWPAGGDAAPRQPGKSDGRRAETPPQRGGRESHSQDPAMSALGRGGKEGGRDAHPPVDEPGQVAAMMDAGDFLVVTGPDAKQIDLRVEPIERDERVYEAVNLRARGVPPSHPMPAGASDRLVIPAFNRGWARYPMLRAGRYTIAFSYQPQWNDPSWTKDGFGRVQSEPVTVEVTEAAPEAIRTAQGPLRLNLKRDGESLAAEVESTWDHELWINLNIGDDLRTHARIDWLLRAKGGGEKKGGEDREPIRWIPASTGDAFSLDRVRRLRPGERLVIGRAPVAALREQLSKEVNPPVHVEVSARYVCVATGPDIREVTANKGRAVKAPTHLYSGTLTSEAVEMSNK